MTDVQPHYRYRLPDALGAGEFTGIRNGDYVLLDIPGTGTVPFHHTIPKMIVPFEPVDDSTVMVHRDDQWPKDIYSRHDTAAEAQGHTVAHWWWHDEKKWVTWEDIFTRGIPRRLSPASLAAQSLYSPPKGICRVCRKPQTIRLDGMIAQHGYKRSGCSGGNQKPMPETNI